MTEKGKLGWRKRYGVALMAVGLATLFCIAIAGLTALVIWQNYRAAQAATEARAVSSAHVVAANIEWMIEASDQALRRIDAVFMNRPIQSSANTIIDLSGAVSDLPAGFQYSVYDETGRLRLSSIPNAAAISVADRDYFHEARANARTVVSRQLQERLTNEQVFIIARGIKRDGSFHGVATIAVPVRKMVEFWSSLSFGQTSTVSVIHNDGWLVARYPVSEKSVNLADAPLFSEPYRSQENGFYHSWTSPIDGQSRLVGFWRVNKWPLIAIAGIENGEISEVFWKTMQKEVVFGLPFILLLLIEGIAIAALLKAYIRRNGQLELALERNNFLFREIHHRVKNNLQAVSALVRLQPIPEQARRDMGHRISAMIAVHEHIYQSDQFDRVAASPYISRVIREIAKAYSGSVELQKHLDDLVVSRDQALPIGLIVNEVVSNAFKYAFSSDRGGKLTVELVRTEGNMARLTIADDGPGYDGKGRSAGMGSKLIAGFVAQLGGQFQFESEAGTKFTMTFPLEAET